MMMRQAGIVGNYGQDRVYQRVARLPVPQARLPLRIAKVDKVGTVMTRMVASVQQQSNHEEYLFFHSHIRSSSQLVVIRP